MYTICKWTLDAKCSQVVSPPAQYRWDCLRHARGAEGNKYINTSICILSEDSHWQLPHWHIHWMREPHHSTKSLEFFVFSRDLPVLDTQYIDRKNCWKPKTVQIARAGPCGHWGGFLTFELQLTFVDSWSVGNFIFIYDHNNGIVDDSISGGAQGKQGSFGLERLMLCVCFFIECFIISLTSNSQFLPVIMFRGLSLRSACSSLWMFVARRRCTKHGNVTTNAIYMKSGFI